MPRMAVEGRSARNSPSSRGARQRNSEPERIRPFDVEYAAGGVALLRMDVPDRSVNTLLKDFPHQLSRVLDEIENNPEVSCVVFTSGKPVGFSAGADLGTLENAKSSADAAELSRSGQRVLSRLERFPKPVVAALHGACLGGGLEIALCCHYAIASDDPATRFGLPEVKLGLVPALGATQRLPKRIGLTAALDVMLTGKELGVEQALALGLIDDAVPRAILIEASVERARQLAATRAAISRRKLSPSRRLRELLLTKNPIGRKLVLDRAFARLLERTHDNLPAPERILDVVRIGLVHGVERGLDAEARAFGELVVSPQAKQLLFCFRAWKALQKDSGSDQPIAARPVHKLGVIGAGQVGSGIAWVSSAIAGLPVRLIDRDQTMLGRALCTLQSLFDEQQTEGRLSGGQRDAGMARVMVSLDQSGLRDADVVVEAVFEVLELKRAVAESVASSGGPNTIFASSTSSVPISEIARGLAHPERVIGMHYVSPVHKLPLLEIAITEKTAPWAVATCVELAKRQGKIVIVVRDGPGFYTTRVLAPYLNEAAHLVSEGTRIETLDRALVEWGFPLGPIKLLDEVGIDVAENVAKILSEAYGERMAPPPGMHQLVSHGRLGKKNGHGFYVYDGKPFVRGARRVDPSVYALLGAEPRTNKPRADLIQRCVLQMVNEAARCFGEATLRSARDGDIGAVLGLGFPAFRGGPLRYVDSLGALEVVRRLERYEKELGARFAPAPVLVEMARSGDTFYGEHAAAPGSVGAARRRLAIADQRV